MYSLNILTVNASLEMTSEPRNTWLSQTNSGPRSHFHVSESTKIGWFVCLAGCMVHQSVQVVHWQRLIPDTEQWSNKSFVLVDTCKPLQNTFYAAENNLHDNYGMVTDRENGNHTYSYRRCSKYHVFVLTFYKKCPIKAKGNND